MKYLGTVILFIWICLGIPARAQTYHFPVSRLLPTPGSEKYYLDHQDQPDESDGPGIRYQIVLQSGFFSNGYGTGLTYSIAPSFRADISQRFTVSGGVSYLSFPGNRLPYASDYSNTGAAAGNHQVVVFLQGTYAIRPDLYVTGTVVKNLNRQTPWLSSPWVYPAGDRYSLKFDYFLTRSIRFGAEIGYRSDPYPIYPVPFQHTYWPW